MKLLIIESCLVKSANGIGEHVNAGQVSPEIDGDQAHSLVRFGRGLYVSKADDPTKGAMTASAELLKSAEAAAKAAKDEK